MRRILVTGMSGTGKSTALAELAKRGFQVVETDVGPWSEWSEADGGYVWSEDLVEELLSRDDGATLFVSAIGRGYRGEQIRGQVLRCNTTRDSQCVNARADESQGDPMTDYVVKPLDASTWDAFARLVERHNGVFGGCWCTWFHTFHAEKTFTAEGNHTLKERLVKEDRAHAALAFDGDEAVAWAQYGVPAELPNIHHRKEYEETLDRLPDYRITCIFVDKKYRRTGVTAIALRGAIDLIAQAGGGVVEGYPHDTTDGKKVSVLYNATRSLYEEAGFDYLRPKGKRNCVMRRVVP